MESKALMLQGFFNRILGRGAADHQVANLRHDRLDPSGTAYVLGDLHGCLALYQRMERAICADLKGGMADLVLLGDLVDRGPDAAGLLDHLLRPAPAGLRRHVVMGNHEVMFLRFLADPARNSDWLGFGGRETLLSYGVDLQAFSSAPRRRQEQILSAHVPDHHIRFLRNLPATILRGDVLFVHAGLNTTKPLHDQGEDDLMWRRNPPLDSDLPAGMTLVHGHIPIAEPDVSRRVINMDVGSYMTNKAVALVLAPGHAPRLLWDTPASGTPAATTDDEKAAS